jgi:hypothetical protein
LEKLGRGNSGTVFKVRRRSDKKFYVVKQVDMNITSSSVSFFDYSSFSIIVFFLFFLFFLFFSSRCSSSASILISPVLGGHRLRISGRAGRSIE